MKRANWMSSLPMSVFFSLTLPTPDGTLGWSSNGHGFARHDRRAVHGDHPDQHPFVSSPEYAPSITLPTLALQLLLSHKTRLTSNDAYESFHRQDTERRQYCIDRFWCVLPSLFVFSASESTVLVAGLRSGAGPIDCKSLISLFHPWCKQCSRQRQ